MIRPMLTELFTSVILCELKLEQFIRPNNVRLPNDAVDNEAVSI